MKSETFTHASMRTTIPHLIMDIDPIVVQYMGMLPIPPQSIHPILEGVDSEHHADGYYWRCHITDENGHIIVKTDPSNLIITHDDLGATNGVLAN